MAESECRFILAVSEQLPINFYYKLLERTVHTPPLISMLLISQLIILQFPVVTIAEVNYG